MPDLLRCMKLFLLKSRNFRCMQMFFWLLGLYGLAVLAMFLLQRHIIYHPVKGLGAPEANGFSAGQAVEILTQDGERLQGWHTRPTSRKETILYLHGNAGHLGDRAYKLKAFAEAGFGVLGISWRGYGDSTGSPTEAGLMADAQAAIDWLKLPPEQLILFGESLGSGVAVRMASMQPARLLVLEAPYISVRRRGQELYPWLPVKYLLQDNFDSLEYIGKVKAPILLLHGAKDAVIPLAHGQQLFAAAPEPKHMVVYPEVGHTDFSLVQLLEPIEQALQQFSPYSSEVLERRRP